MTPRAVLARVRQYGVTVLMIAFFVTVTVSGVVGVVGRPSVSAAEVLPSKVAVVAWCACYVVAGGLGVWGRLGGGARLEVVALVVAALATLLHAAFLIEAGETGVQTGLRMSAGVFLIFAVAVDVARRPRTKTIERVVAEFLEEQWREERTRRPPR